MWRFAPVLVLATACGSRGEPVSVAPISVPKRLAPATIEEPDPVAKGVPHSGEITLVAVTEGADAALTADSSNSLRLWPTLDGSRPPVPIHFASEPSQLAIARSGRDLAAIILDRGGAITVMRLGLDGSARAPRTQLRGDAGFEAVLAIGEHLLARTADHTIELYSLGGARLGRLELEPGQRVTDLAARRNKVAAIIDQHGEPSMRWITIASEGAAAANPTSKGDTVTTAPTRGGDTVTTAPTRGGDTVTTAPTRGGDTVASLRWGASLALPVVPRPGMFAIAPSGTRIALVDTANAGMHVLDLGVVPRPVEGSSRVFVDKSHLTLGFIDDDTVGIVGHSIAWWEKAAPKVPPEDPWLVPDDAARTPPPLGGQLPGGVFADGALVSSHNGSLVIANARKASYLGWSTSTLGGFMGGTNNLVLAQAGAKFMWLDDNLQRVRKVDLQAIRASTTRWAYGAPVGEHHALAQTDNASLLELINVDDTKQRVTVIKQQIEQYYAGEGTLAVKVRNKLHRYKLDLATTTVTEMQPPIEVADYSLPFVSAFDPEVADGLVAVTVSWPHELSEHQVLTYYRLVNGKIEKTRVKKWEMQIVRTHRNGELVVVAHSPERQLLVMKDGAIVRSITRDKMLMPLAIDAEVKRFASLDDNHIVLHDETGAELWRRPFWGASNLTFTKSGERLVVAAVGGLVALDAATGEETARECGFEFGLHDEPTGVGSHSGFASVCEDPIVQ